MDDGEEDFVGEVEERDGGWMGVGDAGVGFGRGGKGGRLDVEGSHGVLGLLEEWSGKL